MRAVAQERERLVALDAEQVVLLQPVVRPLGEHGLELGVVEVDVEQHEVRRALERARRVALVDLGEQARERALRELALVEADRGRARLAVEERVEQVDREVPAQRREVEVELVADREVERRLERVEDEVDLVEDDRALLEEPQQPPELGGRALEVGQRVGRDARALARARLLAKVDEGYACLLYTSPSPRDRTRSRMPSSA